VCASQSDRTTSRLPDGGLHDLPRPRMACETLLSAEIARDSLPNDRPQDPQTPHEHMDQLPVVCGIELEDKVVTVKSSSLVADR